MKPIHFSLLIIVLLATGCASVEPTAIPVNATIEPLSVASPAAAATPINKCQSQLLGRVLDANSAPVKGATVETRSGNFSAKTVSDDNGLYGFAGLCAGTYSFNVTLPGQRAKAVAATIALDGAKSG